MCSQHTVVDLKAIEQLDMNAGLKMFTMVAGPMGMYDGQVGYFE